MRGIHPEEMRRLLDYCAVLQPPRASGTNPSPMSVNHFAALLGAADEKWKAMLLCALNFCMYAIEVSRLEKSEINLDRKTLVTHRDKTGVTRIAVLWDRTVDAIRVLRERNHTRVFLSREGGPFDAEGMRTAFRKLRSAAHISADVKFSHIRDGAYTAAIEGGADLLHAKLLGGHETGISDSYIRRNPMMVMDACAAVEAHYFVATPPTAPTSESQQQGSE
jgi:integrase